MLPTGSWDGAAVPVENKSKVTVWSQVSMACANFLVLLKFLIISLFPSLILQQVLWLWVNLVRNIKACDMLGHRSRYVWGLSQVPVNTSAVQLSRMDNVAAIHSEWHHGLLYMGFTLSQLSQPFATVSFSLSEGKFRYKS